MSEVQVLDKDGVYLAPTTPGNARRLIKSGEAKIISQQPFAIEVSKIVDRPDNSRRIQKMNNTPLNVFEYFKDSQAVFIQNISQPVGILSLEFKRPNGEVIPYKVPASRDPLCLTNFVPFEAIKDSASFMSYLRPSGTSGTKIQLIAEEDYYKHYEKKQELYGKSSVEEVMEDAQNTVAELNTNMPASPVNAEPTDELARKAAASVNPRVVAVCQQLNPEIESTEKINASEAVTALEAIELSIVDTAYILNDLAGVDNPDTTIVKKWTNARQGEIDEGNTDKDIIQSTVNRTPVTV